MKYPRELMQIINDSIQFYEVRNKFDGDPLLTPYTQDEIGQWANSTGNLWPTKKMLENNELRFTKTKIKTP